MENNLIRVIKKRIKYYRTFVRTFACVNNLLYLGIRLAVGIQTRRCAQRRVRIDHRRFRYKHRHVFPKEVRTYLVALRVIRIIHLCIARQHILGEHL